MRVNASVLSMMARRALFLAYLDAQFSLTPNETSSQGVWPAWAPQLRLTLFILKITPVFDRADQPACFRNSGLLSSFCRAGNSSVFYTAEAEVYNAVTLLNGSVFEGHMLQVDQWVKKPTKADS